MHSPRVVITRVGALLAGATLIERGAIEAAPSARGAYALLLSFGQPLSFKHKGAWCGIDTGVYVYAGSAYGPGGIRARLRRHFRKDKRAHWHIDALTVAAMDMTALALEGGNECAIVDRLLGAGGFRPAIAGFGSSDCTHCAAHLLVAADHQD